MSKPPKTAAPVTNKPLRGFASLDAERLREISRKGGSNVAADKRSFSRNPELAAEAGRKGGENQPDTQRSFSLDPSLAAAAGRKGGGRVKADKRSFFRSPELASEAGRMGGANVPAEKRTFSDKKMARKAGQKGAKAKQARAKTVSPLE